MVGLTWEATLVRKRLLERGLETPLLRQKNDKEDKKKSHSKPHEKCDGTSWT
jgi:hypothetical protein